MKYSIITATYNRIAELKELVSSLYELDFPKDKFEFLVIDDGSNDNTKEFLTKKNRRKKN